MDKIKEKNSGLLDETTFGKYFLLGLFLVSCVAFFSLMKLFLVDIIIAAVFASIFYPAYKQVLSVLWNKKSLSAFLCMVLICLVFLVPAGFIMKIVAAQSVEIYHSAGPKVMELVWKADKGALGRIKESRTAKMLAFDKEDFQSAIKEGLTFLGMTTAQIINKTSRATVGLLFHLFIILVSIFFFFRDGERILLRLRDAVPLSEEHKNRLVAKFQSMSRAVIKGTLLVGLIQSACGALTLLAFGVDSWVFWSVVMTVFSVIPFVGTGMVLVPAGLIMIVSGEVWQGVTIILISLLLISSIDNILRPRFIGRDEGMHYLLVFFSIIGGIALFGASGFIIGPLITATFMTVLDMYRVEFREHIDYPKKERG
jgi:predicted PurR-regulated permease PerM